MAEKKELTQAQRIALDLRTQAKELRASSDRQERDKGLCKSEPRFLTAIRAKRKMADDLEKQATALDAK